MSKKLIEWLYSPTHLCVVKSDDSFSFSSFPPMAANSHPQEPLKIIHTIQKNQKQTQTVLKALKRLKTLMKKDVPLTFRPELFKEMNALLKTLRKRFHNRKDIFKYSFGVITALKEQIDKTPQTTVSLCELEWVELEKSVYLLCDWEDEIEFFEKSL